MKKVVVITTGGTIAMKRSPMVGGAVPMLKGDDFMALLPRGGVDLAFEEFTNLPSSHLTPTQVLELGQRVESALSSPDVSGVVVTHGTDTLEETAYLLDLVLNEEKPVVFVGAMRNSSELSWDGPGNLRSAVRVAVDPQARGLGVIVAMNDQLIAAAEATKTHTESTDTFQSRDFGPLGFVDKDRVIVTRRPVQSEGREHIVTDRIEERVDVIKMVAGADGRFINFAIDDGARGLVIEGLGRGHVTVAALPAIDRAIEAGLPVVITSRCPRGRVLDTYAYEGAGRQLRKMGAILGGMLPSHKARIKLMLELGAGWGVERIRKSFEA